MRKLLVLCMLLTTVSHGAVVCKKDGRYWYPENDRAKKIAAMLGVKTCNGKRFKAVLKQLGETSNVKTAAKKQSVEDVVKALGGE